MKKRLLIFLFLLAFVIFPFFSTPVIAQTLFISPTTGTTTTTFEAEISNVENSGKYQIKIKGYRGSYPEQAIDLENGDSTSLTIGPIDELGTFQAQIYYNFYEPVGNTVPITITEEKDLQCYDPCNQSSICPQECPPQYLYEGVYYNKNDDPFLVQEKGWYCTPEGMSNDPPPARPTPSDNITCDSGNGVQTALGCIPTDPMALIKWIFPYLLGFGGLAAFALIVFSGIQILTSAGNPEKVQGAKETITSAITGLLFIILSLFLLRLIGADILQIPGF
ncbi:MAG: pilin [Patescibacteria group bacterium]